MMPYIGYTPLVFVISHIAALFFRSLLDADVTPIKPKHNHNKSTRRAHTSVKANCGNSLHIYCGIIVYRECRYQLQALIQTK